MKKSIVLAAVFLQLALTMIGEAQIPTKRVVAPAPEDAAPPAFDGTKNFMGKAVKSYVGQELFLPCLNGELRTYGYSDFYAYVYPTVDAMLDAAVKSAHKANVYMKGTGNSQFSTRHEALSDRSFTVQSLQIRPADKGLPEEIYFKLSATDRKETLFFSYEERFERSFPFIAMAYFKKQKELLIGKDFLTRGRNWSSTTKAVADINTGKSIEFPVGQTWKCVDVAMASCRLSMILENEKKEQIAFAVTSQSAEHWMVSADAAASLAKRFGKDTWSKALGGQVAVGMPAEAAEFAWGSPQSKNSTVTNGRVSQQWVYKDGRFLYMENGRVSAIQN